MVRQRNKNKSRRREVKFMGEDDQALLEAALTWRARLADADATDDVHAAFGDWLASDPRHAAAYDRAEILWQETSGLRSSDFDKDVLQPTFVERVQSAFLSVRAIFTDRPWARLAFVGTPVVLVFALYFALDSIVATERSASSAHAEAVYETGLGEVRMVTLSDGSEVTLGAMSRVEVAFGSIRDVRLSAGEAFFDVAEDTSRPFTVSASGYHVTVTGTAFEVDRVGETFRVAVTEGAVRVAPQVGIDQSSVRMLTAGQTVAETPQKRLGPIGSIERDKVAQWRRNVLSYYNAPLGQLVADARRYYEPTIAFSDPAVGALEVSAIFSTDDIEDVFVTLAEAFPVDVTINPAGEITISPAG